MTEEQEERLNAKFMRSEVELAENENVILPISMDNPSLTGQALQDILTLIIEQKDKIKTFTIVIADTLRRHYIKENNKMEIALQFGKDWLFRNKKFLDDFAEKTKGTVELKILHWQDYLKNSNYSDALNLVKELYQNNEQFKVRVDHLTNLYKKSGDALTYLLEEIAVLKLWRGILIYPKAKLEKPLDFFLKNYCKELQYLGYFFPRKNNKLKFWNSDDEKNLSSKSNDYSSKAIQICAEFNNKMKALGVPTPNQKKIINEFLEMTDHLEIELSNIGVTNGFRNQSVN